MKKFFALGMVASLVLFTGCSGLFVNSVEVHNGLVTRLDAVFSAEQNFHTEYLEIIDGSTLTQLADYQRTFASAVEELDQYFEEAKFSADQEIFVTSYNGYYKEAIAEYVASVTTFVEDLKANGPLYSEEFAQSYFVEIDGHGQTFVTIHDNLVNEVNLKADY